MTDKKGFVRNTTTKPNTEDLEKTADKLNTGSSDKKSGQMYSYTIKLDEELEKRVGEAAKKHRYTKKGFFLLAIEKFLSELEG